MSDDYITILLDRARRERGARLDAERRAEWWRFNFYLAIGSLIVIGSILLLEILR